MKTPTVSVSSLLTSEYTPEDLRNRVFTVYIEDEYKITYFEKQGLLSFPQTFETPCKLYRLIVTTEKVSEKTPSDSEL